MVIRSSQAGDERNDIKRPYPVIIYEPAMATSIGFVSIINCVMVGSTFCQTILNPHFVSNGCQQLTSGFGHSPFHQLFHRKYTTHQNIITSKCTSEFL